MLSILGQQIPLDGGASPKSESSTPARAVLWRQPSGLQICCDRRPLPLQPLPNSHTTGGFQGGKNMSSFQIPIQLSQVRIGDHDLGTDGETTIPEKTIEVTKITIHPEYSELENSYFFERLLYCQATLILSFSANP